MHWVARGALFIALLPLAGACAAALWYLCVELFYYPPPDTFLWMFVFLVFGCLVWAAAWAIRGPWWLRVPATCFASLGGLLVAFWCGAMALLLASQV